MNRIRLFATFLTLMAMTAFAQANRSLSVILEAPWWLIYNVQVFYTGDASPFYSQNLMGGAGINFGSLQNRSFFVRVYTYPNASYGVSARTDQSLSFVFIDPNRQGIMRVHPGKAYLDPYLTNLTRG
jgi:hypothetical protein